MKLRLILSATLMTSLLATNVALADISPPPDAGADAASTKDASVPTDGGIVTPKDSGTILVPDDSGAVTTRTDAGVTSTNETDAGGCSIGVIGTGSTGLSVLLLLPLFGRRRREKGASK